MQPKELRVIIVKAILWSAEFHFHRLKNCIVLLQNLN
jgi:hypothetical protein